MSGESAPRRSGDVLLATRLRYADRKLVYGRARLYPDRIRLWGLGWTGRWHRTIPLEDVAEVTWTGAGVEDVNVLLHLVDGQVMRLSLHAAGLWKFRVEELLGIPWRPQDQLPGHISPASAA